MAIQEFKTWIKSWIEEYVSVPQEVYGNRSPCPYARAVWTDNKVNVKYIDTPDLRDFWKCVSVEIMKFDNAYDVVIVGMKTNTEIITSDQLAGSVDALNSFLNEQKKDLWLLNMYADYTLVLIQKISLLDDASKSLEKDNYYKDTNQYYYNKYVIQRRKLRENLNE